MVIVEERIDIEQFNSASDVPPAPGIEESRSRDCHGHCWDGLRCDHGDHGDHGAQGTIHFIR
jgi:hypothetical protein